jgi:hypothetical protein
MKNNIKGILALVFFVGMGSYIAYSIYQLKNNFKITAAKVNEIQVSGFKNSPGDYCVLYEYYIDGEKYKSSSCYSFCNNTQTVKKVRALLQDKTFPVAYAQKSKSVSFLLILQKDADKYNYIIPDSLRIYDSVLSCK